MKQLWNALIARLVYWLTPKPPVVPPAPIVKAPEPPLTPGICQCGHIRNCHIEGKWQCSVGYPANSEHNKTNSERRCACQIFILDDDEDEEEEPETPSPEELEKLYQK